MSLFPSSHHENTPEDSALLVQRLEFDAMRAPYAGTDGTESRQHTEAGESDDRCQSDTPGRAVLPRGV